MNRQQRGRHAEASAKRYLQACGLQFLEANFNRRIGEIDLVMREPDSGTIVFVEVRFRTHSRFGGAAGSIDWRKQQRLRAAASLWLQLHRCSTDPARIDVLAMAPRPQHDIERDIERGVKHGPDRDPDAAQNEVMPQAFEDYRIIWLKSAIEG